jgi:hypothetical protein
VHALAAPWLHDPGAGSAIAADQRVVGVARTSHQLLRLRDRERVDVPRLRADAKRPVLVRVRREAALRALALRLDEVPRRLVDAPRVDARRPLLVRRRVPPMRVPIVADFDRVVLLRRVVPLLFERPVAVDLPRVPVLRDAVERPRVVVLRPAVVRFFGALRDVVDFRFVVVARLRPLEPPSSLRCRMTVRAATSFARLP